MWIRNRITELTASEMEYCMITEIAILNINNKQNELFEAAFNKAKSIISSMKGYMEHELQKCLEEDNKYLLIVRWKSLEDHTEGFRKSDAYQEWKKILHHFYNPFPVVQHYRVVQ